jgi:hypothetical protein
MMEWYWNGTATFMSMYFPRSYHSAKSEASQKEAFEQVHWSVAQFLCRFYLDATEVLVPPPKCRIRKIPICGLISAILVLNSS